MLSGQRLDDFLRERILDPLGMVDTGFTVADENVERFAACYRPGQACELLLVVEDRPDASSRYTQPRTYLSGAGGMVSTTTDYMRFCKMLANGGTLDGRHVIGPRTLAYMACNHLPGGHDLAHMSPASAGETSRAGVGFGLGFACVLDPTVLGVLSVPGEYYRGRGRLHGVLDHPRRGPRRGVHDPGASLLHLSDSPRVARDYLRLDHRLGEEGRNKY